MGHRQGQAVKGVDPASGKVLVHFGRVDRLDGQRLGQQLWLA